MAEELSELRKGWEVWRNPIDLDAPVVYLGEFYPPEGQFFLRGSDLRALGYGQGDYTVLAPEEFSHSDTFARWQKVSIP